MFILFYTIFLVTAQGNPVQASSGSMEFSSHDTCITALNAIHKNQPNSALYCFYK